MGVIRCCCFCAAVPVSAIILLVAALIPQITPKAYCDFGSDGACTRAEVGLADACEAGTLLRVTRQHEIGLVHITLVADVPFARLDVSGCTVVYSLSCGGGAPNVVETWRCAKGAEPKPTTPRTLGRSWEVCAQGAPLMLLASVVNLVFDIDMPAGTSVAGCIGLAAPSSFPALRAVRGSSEKQREALIAAKKEAGGCPTWRSEEEFLARSEDFIAEGHAVMAFVVRRFLLHKKALLPELAKGIHTTTPTGSVSQIPYFLALAAASGGLPGWTSSVINCGEMMPSVLPAPGMAITRHAEIARLVGDPFQRRTQIIGGGAPEACFDATLPVFMSTGAPEHSQVRKLWDSVGVATMHEGDVPEVAEPPATLYSTGVRMLRDAIGMQALQLDEVGPLVAPMFLEKLWRRKPTAHEAAEISAYTTFGGLCIFGQATPHLPVVPGKIKAIREKAFAFALDSPVGKALAKEIEKPEYLELRAVYTKRPKGVVGTAVQNLVDASLFAGLVGTSTLTANCLKQVFKGPTYVRMFRENSTAFLLETMRMETAVGGSTSVLRAPLKSVVFGEQVTLPEGSLLCQGTGLNAGYDASVFPDPTKFDTSRDNLAETMNWNGKSKYVLARDYENAPRFCPGMALSIKIATKLCNHFSKQLSAA